MNSPNPRPRRTRAPKFLASCAPKVAVGVGWREGAAVGAGFLVLLITSWLIWAALAEAALATIVTG